MSLAWTPKDEPTPPADYIDWSDLEDKDTLESYSSRHEKLERYDFSDEEINGAEEEEPREDAD